MVKTTEHTSGVIAVTRLASLVEPRIGSYLEHYRNEAFNFSVRLTEKGAITMSEEVAHDYETQPSSVTQDRIDAVAATYRLIG